jgi:creatinine amidohydrolase/Fe(II)-dependent formamide hydrolase-like protein
MDAKAGELLPGSLYFIKQDLFLNLLRGVVQNVQEQGFKKLIIVSAHSGTAQQQTLETLITEKFGNLKLYIFPGKIFEGGIDHAGPIESSLMLAINKSLVHLHRIKDPMGPIIGENIQFASEKDGLVRINKIVNQIIKTIRG